jgi:hypothetical protein
MSPAAGVVAPHDFDLERAVLGATFHSVDALRDVLAEATVADLFYIARHRAVVGALGELAAGLNGAPPARALVRAVAAARGDDLDDALLLALEDAGFLVTDVGPYLTQLRELAARREEHAAAVMLAKATRDATLWAAVRQRLAAAEAWRARSTDPARATETTHYIEPIAGFLAEEDPPVKVIFPELLPCGVIMLLHGEPRARKSLAAAELALAAATGTAPFGLARFAPAQPVSVLYVLEEDPRPLTRPRLRALVTARCGDTPPQTLHVAVRRGVDLDDPAWVVSGAWRVDPRLVTRANRPGNGGKNFPLLSRRPHGPSFFHGQVWEPLREDDDDDCGGPTVCRRTICPPECTYRGR